MKLYRILVLLVVTCFVMSMKPWKSLISENDDKRESTIMYTMMGIIDYLHFQPREVDDQLSKEIWKDYIDQLDRGKRFFTQDEINKLSFHKETIDNEIFAFSFIFFDKSENLISKAHERGARIYNSLIESDFDYSTIEDYETDSEKKDFAQSETELLDYWRKYLKFNIVSKIDSYQDNLELKDSLSFSEMEVKARKEVKKLHDDWFERLEKIRREDRFEEFMNTIMAQFDPHSNYFSPKEKENWDIRMGNKLEGIGARLQQDGDYVKVHSIVPGGPAWKGKELEVDDVIYSVKQKGEEAVDITGMRMDDVIRMVRGDKETVVTLKVKKKNGKFENVSIVRDEVILDDAAARSVILGLENEVENIGYIHLPIFYSTFDGGTSCAKDVKKEIEKLKEEQVSGIILDLRYNGGGSLPDAIEMAGLFIEEGPIVQVKSRDKKPQVHYDPDASAIYDGPLIVLVNEVSASASEILAGALQDYNRAIIVGGEKTFGKATVQGVYDLDRMITGEDEIKPLGQVKLTTQKFFRIDGTSNQLRGVVPDIVIPDQFSYVDYGEDLYEDALTYSEIKPAKFNQDVYRVKALDVLKKNSSLRVNESEFFDDMKTYGALLKSREDETTVSLDLESYRKEADEREEMMKPYENIFETPVKGIQVSNLNADKEYLALDESREAKNIDFIESLTQDYYLKEALMIMQDALEQDKRLAHK